LPFAFSPVGDSHRSLAIQRPRQGQQHQQQQQQQQGIALCGRWHFGSRNDSVQKEIAGHSGEDGHPQQVGDRPLHEILAGDSATTRLQTPSSPPPAAATRQQIGTGQRAGHNEGTTNNNIFHSLDRDAAATTTTAIQCDPTPPPPQFQSSLTCQIFILGSLVGNLIHNWTLPPTSHFIDYLENLFLNFIFVLRKLALECDGMWIFLIISIFGQTITFCFFLLKFYFF
jgi:hypothetical protein